MKKSVWLFQPINGLKADAVPIVVPFAVWQEAANQEVMYSKK